MIQYEHASSEGSFLSSVEPEILTSEQVNSVMNQLTSTIEISTLVSLYFTQVNKYLPLIGINMSEFDKQLSAGIASSEYTVSLPVSAIRLDHGKHAAFVHYVFDENLTPAQRRVLATLHQLFTRPLLHALEFQRLRLMATKDPLTNLGNRNGFNEATQRLINRFTRNGQTFGLLVVDLDNFKQVNDKFGHQQGDEVLITTAEILTDTIRGHEEAYRFGGDEFCCLLDVSSAAELSAIAERIHDAMHAHPLFRKHGVTCSIGGSLLRENDSMGELFDRADKALYVAKEDGKDTYQAA
ncbi:hypothetical protein BFC17_13140 [Alteromonas lipolytica]|uniref:diguanylate cyclase n=2 Tax=Alteromonas lipolytica TaxID=1856405 RepID=A0A1E8FF49_9ALTE|nr:hypothetical protein BFC17_13140 [Alteromonas lipolytica]